MTAPTKTRNIAIPIPIAIQLKQLAAQRDIPVTILLTEIIQTYMSNQIKPGSTN